MNAGCIHPPTTLADAEAVLVCFGGTAWRDSFVLGLGTVALFAVAVVGLFVLVRAVR
jgi:hypothetical protein